MNIRKIDVNLLLCFDALCTERHVSRAAERVQVSQPAMSAALMRLRAIFNDPLFLRTSHGMVPTSRCAELVEPVRSILAQISDVITPRNLFDPALSDATFSVVATDYVQLIVLPPLMKRLREIAPGIKLRVKPADPKQLVQKLELGEIDLAIGYLPIPPDTLRSRLLFNEDFVLVSSRQHTAVRPDMSLDAFCSLRHIAVSPTGGGFFSAIIDVNLAESGHQRNIALSIPHFLVAPEIVRSTDLVAIVPRRQAMLYEEGGALQVTNLPIHVASFKIHMFWHERSHRDDMHTWMRHILVELFQDLNADMAKSQTEVKDLQKAVDGLADREG